MQKKRQNFAQKSFEKINCLAGTRKYTLSRHDLSEEIARDINARREKIELVEAKLFAKFKNGKINIKDQALLSGRLQLEETKLELIKTLAEGAKPSDPKIKRLLKQIKSIKEDMRTFREDTVWTAPLF